MPNISEINVAELDFDLIKQAFIDYFKADPTFADYEFEGSSLNILLDILSYNTHMNAVMANMSANEMFIDSAQLRQSIVSIAKSLAYTPRSIVTAQASIDVVFSNVTDSPPYITVAPGTRFSTAAGYPFSTNAQYLAYPDTTLGSGYYSVRDMTIYEGLKADFTYVIDWTNEDQKFVIPSANADISSLVVSVTTGSIVTLYSLNENITVLDNDSTVYFLHENPDGFFEVTFGDGILGKKPINGSTVVLSYVISKAGEEANNINTFTAYQLIDGYSTYTITTKIKAFGASARESQESIQFRAPKLYKAQNRAVTTEDYENFMLKEYPFIESISVWGGEYNDPPTYGKVFLAIKPSHTEFLSANLKAKIKEELIKKYNVVTVTPEIVDPIYLYLNLTVNNIYKKENSTYSEAEISTIVKNNILAYSSDYLQKFNKPFYYSYLTNIVTSSEVNIVSSLINVLLMMKIYPTVGTNVRFELKFNNALVPGSVYSTYYNTGLTGSTSKQGIFDNGNGTLYTKNIVTGDVVFSNIGTVSYDTGILDFTFLPYVLPTDTLDVRFYAEPVERNVVTGNNQILVIDNSNASQDYNRKPGTTVVTVAENLDYK